MTNPALLAETIADLSSEDVTYLAKAISYDLQKTDRVAQAYVPSDCGSQTADAIARLLYAEAGNSENAKLLAFEDTQEMTVVNPTDAELMVTEYLNVRTPVISFSSAEVFEQVSASVTISSNVLANYDRTYRVELYKSDGTTDSLICMKRVTIPANSVGATVSIPFTFNATGVYSIYAKGYVDFENATTTSHTGSVTVTGQWNIAVELTDDRTQLGTITLYNASGTVVSSSICLGKSARNYPMNQTYGHTPIGVYTGYLANHYDSNDVYGPYKVIKMTGISGYVVEECSHRTGIWIHGGREGYNNNVNDPSYPLYNTEGCVRVTNAYQLQLQDEITALVASHHDSVGIITITQNGSTTLTGG